jgi:hypothetical protein
MKRINGLEQYSQSTVILRCDIPVVYCSQCTIGEMLSRREHNKL